MSRWSLINKTPKPLRKAGAILVTKDKFFIFVQNRYQTNQCNGKGSIGIPKGSMKSFESYQDCAIREVKEELGIKISITDKNKTRRISGVKFFIVNLNVTKNTFISNHWLKTNDLNEISGIIIMSETDLIQSDKYFFNSSLSYFAKLIKNNVDFRNKILQ